MSTSRALYQAITNLAPTAEFVIRGEAIEWLSPDVAQPSPEAIAAEMARLATVIPVPVSVSAAQGRLALLQAGVLDALEDWVVAQPRATQIEYYSRGTWRRDWPLVATGATVMGLTEGQVDDLFILAATL